MADEAKDTRARLVETAIRALARFGLRGATTRRIAADAGVAELTLFRHFRSKQELLATAIAEFRPPIRVPEPTDDVAADLRALLTAYVTLTDEQQELILGLFAELLRHPELLPERPPPGMSSVMGEVVQLFRHHQATGRLWREEPPEELALAFVGPLMARFLLRSVLGVVFPLDPEAYVRGFLAGRGADRGQGER
ncbi:MAG: helix-turn-helix domain-containing protein [Thermomicrobium sp.]|nr:helix-turn-helix domain-containing protein [Thermomicrobium sp.]